MQFVITGLGGGGAERMLLKLLTRIDRNTFEPEVISLTQLVEASEPLTKGFNDIGVPVHSLGMRPGVPDPRKIFRLAKWFRKKRPHLVSTWMYHADLIGGLAAKLAGNIPVVWNIRHSNLESLVNKNTTLLTARCCALLSKKLPAKIICCGEVPRIVHVENGYDASKMVVIPNGFDLSSFKPNPGSRERIRRQLGLPTDAVAVGLVARFNPQKDHKNFVCAAALLKRCEPDSHFVLCGEGISWENAELCGWIKEFGLQSSFHLLGHRADIMDLNCALDVATSSSSCGEGFPNVLGEAMACEIPCVATDVGDSALIIGDTGKVVPAGDSVALAEAWRTILALIPEDRTNLGIAARKRIQDHFSLAAVAQKYEDLFLFVLGLSSLRQLHSQGP
ncbi:MAG: glycosyltransferase [Deltaproteobacteria bacterium]|nr:glycosyltransferase [Deltaproteobacteria bacterium]